MRKCARKALTFRAHFIKENLLKAFGINLLQKFLNSMVDIEGEI